MLLTAGFTASRNISGVHPCKFSDVLERLGHVSAFITGGCRGGDVILGQMAARYYPGASHLVIVPNNTTQVDYWWLEPEFNRLKDLKIYLMPEGSTYQDRNSAIVKVSKELYAFPEYPEHDARSKRSGTWQTVRLAREKGIPIGVSLTR